MDPWQVIKQPLRYGAGADSRDKSDITSPSRAAQNGFDPVVQQLLDGHDAVADPRAGNGRTRLSYAGEMGRWKVVRHLLERETSQLTLEITQSYILSPRPHVQRNSPD